MNPRPRPWLQFLAAAICCTWCSPALAGEKLNLTAEQSTGGKTVTLSGGSAAVTLDVTCTALGDRGVGVEWKVPLPAGWWHGTLHLGPREGDDKGWVNTHLGIVLMSLQKPLVNMMSNIRFNEKRFDEQTFSFWIYSAVPAEGVRLQSVYDDLYKYKRTWPVLRLEMEPGPPAALAEQDPVTLDVMVEKDGSAPLPGTLPPGVWTVRGSMTKEGSMTCAGEDGRAIEVPFAFDRWQRPDSLRVYIGSPWQSVRFETAALFKSAVLQHVIDRSPAPLAVEGQLIETVDPKKSQSAEFILLGRGLQETAAPVFPLVPRGCKFVVLTTWDDGQISDRRCAEILNRHGYRPTFFMNQNSAAMKILDQLEALGAEIGSHCYHHPSLYEIAPEQAKEECVAMRKILESQLQHPVISFAYPNGYSPAYDIEGDYVVRAVKAAGYWSGRTTVARPQTVDSVGDPATLASDGFFGNAKDLERVWAETKNREGGIFYFWGHSWQIGHTDEEWQKFDAFAAQFAHDPAAWYATQGEFSIWLWARQNVHVAVASQAADKVTVTLTRPWLHPWLAAECPLSLNLPPGVEKVLWQGKELPITNGRVDFSWRENSR